MHLELFPFPEFHDCRQSSASPNLVKNSFFGFVDFLCSSCQFVSPFFGNYYNSSLVADNIISWLYSLAAAGYFSIDLPKAFRISGVRYGIAAVDRKPEIFDSSMSLTAPSITTPAIPLFRLLRVASPPQQAMSLLSL